MAWTSLPTYTAGSVLTAAQMNAIAANINETSAAAVTTAGDMTYADAANSMGSRLAIGSAGSLLASTGSAPVWRVPGSSGLTNTTLRTFTSTSYVDVDAGGTSDPGGDATSVTVTTGTKAIIILRARISNNTGGSFTLASFRVSGATTLAADDSRCLNYEASNANDVIAAAQVIWYSSLTGGSNTFTMQCRVTGNTGSIRDTEITVIPL